MTGRRGGSYPRYMPRRVVWYPAGSPAATQLSALPGDLEAFPLPAAGAPPAGPDESAVVLVDLTAGDAAVAAALAASAPDLPVVALVAPGATPAVPCYAYVAAPAAPEVLAAALRNACDHARRPARGRREPPRAAGAQPDRRQPLRRAGHRRAPHPHPEQGARDHPERRGLPLRGGGRGRRHRAAALQAGAERFGPGAVHRVHPADRRRQRGRLRGADRRGAPARRRLRAASRARISASIATSTSGSATAPSPCWWSRWPRRRAT